MQGSAYSIKKQLSTRDGWVADHVPDVPLTAKLRHFVPLQEARSRAKARSLWSALNGQD